MYTAFFHLRERPFELTANPRFFFLTETHRSAVVTIWYGITARKGLSALIGEAGTGKTSVVQTVISRLRDQASSCAYLDNPTLSADEFRRFIARSFQLSPAAAECKTTLIGELRARLIDNDLAGHPTVLIIDEAQVLPDALLEEVRLLANLETDDNKLLQVLLVGQPELAERLDRPGLRQLKQRLALRVTLESLNAADTAALIAGRIRIAGGDPAAMFSDDAIRAVTEYAGGIPRLVHVICDNALIGACAAGQATVDRALVLDACVQLALAPPRPLAPPERKAMPWVATSARDFLRPAQPSVAAEAPDDVPMEASPALRPERAMFSYPEPSRFRRIFQSRASAS